MKYHVFRRETPFTKPGEDIRRCIRCDKRLTDIPTSAELAGEACPVAGMWSPPDWLNVDRQANSGRRHLAAVIARETPRNVTELLRLVHAPEDKLDDLKRDLDWLAFNGLIELTVGGMRITALGRWRLDVDKIGADAGRQPSILTDAENKAVGAARAARAHISRSTATSHTADNTNRDLLRALMLDHKLPPEFIDPLASAIGEKFLLRLRRAK